MKAKTPIRKKFDRALTLLLALTVIGGSIHWVFGDTDLPAGIKAPTLELELGQEDYDLLEGITVDESIYDPATLKVMDKRSFDITEAGDYTVLYSVESLHSNDADTGAAGTPGGENKGDSTPAAPEQPDNSGAETGGETGTPGGAEGGSTGENTENTGSTGETGTPGSAETGGENKGDSIGETGTPGGTENAGETGTPGGSEDGANGDANTEDAPANTENSAPAADEVALFSLPEESPAPVAETGDSSTGSTGSTGGNAENGSADNSGAADSADKGSTDNSSAGSNADSGAADGADADAGYTVSDSIDPVVYFSRTVRVIAPEQPPLMLAADEPIAGSFTVELGQPVWSDDAHTKFQFSNAKITAAAEVADRPITVLTITLSNGTIPESVYDTWKNEGITSFRDNMTRSATWIFTGKGKQPEEIEKAVRGMVFNWVQTGQMNVYCSVSANENTGFDRLTNVKLTQWRENGHYYLFVPKKLSWTRAIEQTGYFKLAGQQGYLATFSSMDERRYMQSLYNGIVWVGATCLTWDDNTRLNNPTDKDFQLKTLKNDRSKPYYWATGPEAGQLVEASAWNPGEPNKAADGSGGVWDNTLDYVQGSESCADINGDYMNDIREGNRHDIGAAMGFFVEFGGYAEGFDPGNPDNKLMGHQNVLVQPKDAEAKIGELRYAKLSEALAAAQAGETVEIITPQIDAAALSRVELKKDVTIQTYKDPADADAPTYTYKAVTADEGGAIIIGVNETGEIGLTHGTMELSPNAPVGVYVPVNGVKEPYDLTAPDCTSTLVVDENDAATAPYLTGETDGVLYIGHVGYTYTNDPAEGAEKTKISIPKAMVNNERVTRAEIQADLTGKVWVNGEDDRPIVFEGKGKNTDKAEVTYNAKGETAGLAEVKLPEGIHATVFGHKVTDMSADGVIIQQKNQKDTDYPDRASVALGDGEYLVADGYQYEGERKSPMFYLGAFGVDLQGADGLPLTDGLIITQNDVVQNTAPNAFYRQNYVLKLKLKDNYYMEGGNQITVSMKDNDKAAGYMEVPGAAQYDADSQTYTVTIPKVTGDIIIKTNVKRAMTNLTVDITGAGKCTVTDMNGKAYTAGADGKTYTVPRNEKLTVTFAPKDFSNPYHSKLTGEEGSSFSLLTGLKNGEANVELTQAVHEQPVKDTETQDGGDAGLRFNWQKKSYAYTYTATGESNTLTATFTKSHVFRTTVTGGTVAVTKEDGDTTGLVHRLEANANPAQDFHDIIVPDQTKLKVTMTQTGTDGDFKATWSGLVLKGNAGEKQDGEQGEPTEINTGITVDGNKRIYTTPEINNPYFLNATFKATQTVTLTVKNGTALDQLPAEYKPAEADEDQKYHLPTWTKGGETYTTEVDFGKQVYLVVQPTKGYEIKSIKLNGIPVDIAASLGSGNVQIVPTDSGNVYVYKSLPVLQKWDAEVEFDQKLSVTFQPGGGEQDVKADVMHGSTIPSEKYDEATAAAKKSPGKTFVGWIDNAFETTNRIYTKLTEILTDLILKPFYRDGESQVKYGSTGGVIVADDLNMSQTALAYATDDELKKAVDVKAYDQYGNALSSDQITVNQQQLQALKKQGVGSFKQVLTFTVNASNSGIDGLSVTVDANIGQSGIQIIGKTGHTLTFRGVNGVDYQVTDQISGAIVGTQPKTDAQGVGTATGLEKNKEYKIQNAAYQNSITAKTMQVDAASIAQAFADVGANTDSNNLKTLGEKAWNDNVEVTVNGNNGYKIKLLKDINRTVKIPDIWENVTLDLNGHTIQGLNATDGQSAQPGLIFEGATAAEKPGTHLTVINSGNSGAIKGGSGSAEFPDGAAGVLANTDAAKAEITVGKGAAIFGGNGANGKADATARAAGNLNGGKGGNGISGNILATVTDGGSVTGGKGGNGADAANGAPGKGGDGGVGIQTNHKNVTVKDRGTVTGGQGGNGGNATGTNTNKGGNGGAGGMAIDRGNASITNAGGTINGGAGGKGGTSAQGVGGNGGAGGSGDNNNNTGSGGTGGDAGTGGAGDGKPGKPGENGGGTTPPGGTEQPKPELKELVIVGKGMVNISGEATYTVIGKDQDGKAFDLTNVTLTWSVEGNHTGVTINNGTLTVTKDAAEGQITVKVASVAVSAEKRVTLTKGEIKPGTLQRIEITTKPDKTTYTKGEQFNPAGMVVTATHSDGSTKVLNANEYKILLSGPLNNVGAQTITISYEENGVTKTATLTVTVNDNGTDKPGGGSTGGGSTGGGSTGGGSTGGGSTGGGSTGGGSTGGGSTGGGSTGGGSTGGGSTGGGTTNPGGSTGGNTGNTGTTNPNKPGTGNTGNTGNTGTKPGTTNPGTKPGTGTNPGNKPGTGNTGNSGTTNPNRPGTGSTTGNRPSTGTNPSTGSNGGSTGIGNGSTGVTGGVVNGNGTGNGYAPGYDGNYDASYDGSYDGSNGSSSSDSSNGGVGGIVNGDGNGPGNGSGNDGSNGGFIDGSGKQTVSFLQCSYHWTPAILTVSMVAFALGRIRQIRKKMDLLMNRDEEGVSV